MAVLHLGFTTFSGLSADTKPAGIGVGSTFYETDTRKSYIYDGSAWVKTGTVTAQTEPLSPVNVSASPTREEIQGMLDYSRSISNGLRKAGVFSKALPTIVGRLDPTATEFGFKTDPGEEFTVEQDGTVRTFTSKTDGLVTKVDGVHGNSDITITLVGSSTFFKFANHPGGTDDKWVSVTLVALGDITTLNSSFHRMLHLESFDCIADTSKVTSFDSTWEKCFNLKAFPLIDTSGATSLNKTWKDCKKLKSFPLIDTSNVVTFDGTWMKCTELTSFPQIDTSAAVVLKHTWNNCGNLTSFPFIKNSGNVVAVIGAWQGCSSLKTFPKIDTSSVTNFGTAWQGCHAIKTFPHLDTSSGTNLSQTWQYFFNIEKFPEIDTSSASNLQSAWDRNRTLMNFPALDLSNGLNFHSTWYMCSGLTEFPRIDVSAGTSFYGTWVGCTKIKSFPALDFSNGGSFFQTFLGCHILKCFQELDFSNLNHGHETFKDCHMLTQPAISGTDVRSNITAKNGKWTNSNPCP